MSIYLSWGGKLVKSELSELVSELVFCECEEGYKMIKFEVSFSVSHDMTYTHLFIYIAPSRLKELLRNKKT